ncbi:MAG: hypothetical protein JW952_01125 [Candidatus Eisenbacteria bacterium]|nr:hypothetical protein [Candidatus Eisenbacteria bacterium]
MKQHEAVIKVMEENGGYASLAFLYQNVLRVPGCSWGTKTPFASIRRIVQDPRFFFKIRPGLWALNSARSRLRVDVVAERGVSKLKRVELDHTHFQGLLVELGNSLGFRTVVPSQDKNKLYLGTKLSAVASMEHMCEFSYDRFVRVAGTIDVSWFNERGMPARLLEVEHSTAITGSLLKFVELQDFNAGFCIVADEVRRREFNHRLTMQAFRDISARVNFWSYEDVSELRLGKDILRRLENRLGL